MIFHVLKKFSSKKEGLESNLGPLKFFDPSTRKVLSADTWSTLLVLLVKLRIEDPRWSPSRDSVFCRMLTPLGFRTSPTKSTILTVAERIHTGEIRVGDIGAFVGQIIMALGDDEDPLLVLSEESDKKALRELGVR